MFVSVCYVDAYNIDDNDNTLYPYVHSWSIDAYQHAALVPLGDHRGDTDR